MRRDSLSANATPLVRQRAVSSPKFQHFKRQRSLDRKPPSQRRVRDAPKTQPRCDSGEVVPLCKYIGVPFDDLSGRLRQQRIPRCDSGEMTPLCIYIRVSLCLFGRSLPNLRGAGRFFGPARIQKLELQFVDDCGLVAPRGAARLVVAKPDAAD